MSFILITEFHDFSVSVRTQDNMKLEVLTLANIKITAFWDMMPYSLVDIYQCSVGI
jgi:hypothetical protein